MASKATTMTLELLVDTKNQRVLVAKAGKDFIDFLFSILTLPLGSISRLHTKQEMLGSLRTLYDSIEVLSDTYLPPNKKEHLLKPKVVNPITTPLTPFLKIESIPHEPKKYFRCDSTYYGICRQYVTVDDPNTPCPQCNTAMSETARFVKPSAVPSESSSVKDGYVRGIVTYMVMDDLVVKPMSTISWIALLRSFNINNIGDLEENAVTIGLAEAINLLKASLESKMVLTDVFLKNKKIQVKSITEDTFI